MKPEAPVNLTIRNMSSNQLQLTWSSPYPKAHCLEHVVKYKSNKDTSWMVTAPALHLPLATQCWPSPPSPLLSAEAGGERRHLLLPQRGL